MTARKKPDQAPLVPAVSDSSNHRLAWNRERLASIDERALIDDQIASAQRIADHCKAESDSIYEARVVYADRARTRDHEDADKILEAATEALRIRQSELDRVISGLEAAINASSKNHADGVQSGE